MAGLMLNEDDTHFMACYTAEQMNAAGIDDLVSQYVSGQMKELVFNVNSQLANFPSKVWPTMWQGFDPALGADQPALKRMPEAWRENSCKVFREMLKIDLPQLWIDRVRQSGKSPWLSVRMNDVHGATEIEDYFHSEFWRENVKYWRVPAVDRPVRDWTERAFDYRHKEVREYHCALIREVVERYDCDGLELDWMRFSQHIAPGHEEEGREILIGFMRQVRELVDATNRKRGRRMLIGVRVPSRPWTARGVGVDAVTWSKEKLIDWIVATPFWATIEPDMPIEIWKQMLEGTDVKIAAGLEINLRSSPKSWPKYGDNFANTAETVMGAASSLLSRGADRVYLFNYMHRGPSSARTPEEHQYIINHAGEIETATQGRRRHVVTYSDVVAAGETQALALPAECTKDQPGRFRVHVGPNPANRASRVVVGLGEAGVQDFETVTVRVNGVVCANSTQALPAPIHPVVQKAAAFEIASGVLHGGYNHIEVEASDDRVRQIFWIEIVVDGETTR